MKAQTMPFLAVSRIAAWASGGSLAMDWMKLENETLECEVESEESEASPALLLKTVSMMVIANVPPKGTAKEVSAITDAILFGKKPIPCLYDSVSTCP